MQFLSEGAVVRPGLPGTDTFLSPLRDQLGRFDARTGRGCPGRFSVVGRPGTGDDPAGLGADLAPEETGDTTTPRTGLRQWFVRPTSWQAAVVRERCRRRLAREVWLLSWRRVWLRVVARLNWEDGPAIRTRSSEARSPEAIERWIAAEVRNLAGEQREELRAGLSWRDSRDRDLYRTLARALAWPPARARVLCVGWNALPIDERRRLWADTACALRTGSSSARAGR